MVVEPAPSSSTEGAVESTSNGSESRSASRPSANRIQDSLAGRPDGRPRNQPGSSADRNSIRSAMLARGDDPSRPPREGIARPNEPTGTPTHSAGGGRAGGVPSRNTSPSRPAPAPALTSAPALASAPAFALAPGPSPSRAKAAVTRTTSLPSWVSAASPNAVLRPLRITDMLTAAGPAVPGRRK